MIVINVYSIFALFHCSDEKIVFPFVGALPFLEMLYMKYMPIFYSYYPEAQIQSNTKFLMNVIFPLRIHLSV